MPSSIFTPRHQEFIEFLKTERVERSVTQEELARRLGRPQSFISKYERGERRLDVIEFIQVVEALGESPVAILARFIDFKGP